METTADFGDSIHILWTWCECVALLHRLLEGAQGNGTGICDVCIYTSALGSLLGQVVTGSDRAVAAGHNFMQSRIAGSRLNVLSTDLLSTVIDSVATTSRCVWKPMFTFFCSKH